MLSNTKNLAGNVSIRKVYKSALKVPQKFREVSPRWAGTIAPYVNEFPPLSNKRGLSNRIRISPR